MNRLYFLIIVLSMMLFTLSGCKPDTTIPKTAFNVIYFDQKFIINGKDIIDLNKEPEENLHNLEHKMFSFKSANSPKAHTTKVYTLKHYPIRFYVAEYRQLNSIEFRFNNKKSRLQIYNLGITSATTFSEMENYFKNEHVRYLKVQGSPESLTAIDASVSDSIFNMVDFINGKVVNVDISIKKLRDKEAGQ